MISLADIAKQTGVSRNTVSLALRSPPTQRIPLRPATIQKIRKVAQALHYVPNRIPRVLRSKRSNLIGLVVREFCNPQFARMNQAIINELERRGFEVLLTDVPDMQDSKHMEDLYSHRVDGIIVGPLYSSPLCPFLHRLARARFPIVALYADSQEGVDAIRVDNADAARQAMRHLFSQGHRRIGCYVVDERHPTLAAYRELMCESGFAIDPAWIFFKWGSAEQGLALGRQVSVGDGHPTAYLFHDDHAALGFMRGVWDRGMRVPRDLAVVGTGDYPFSALGLVTLSSIRPPIESIVRHTVDFLLARLEKRPRRGWQQITLRGELVIRESSTANRNASEA